MIGRYDYFLNEAPIDVYETFRITRDDGLATVISSERVANAFGSHLRVDARLKDRAYDQVEITYTSSGAERIRTANLRVKFHASTAEAERVVDDLSIHQRINLPDEYLFLPLLRVFTGKVIIQLLEKPLSVLIPNIRDPQDAENWFALGFEERWSVQDGDAFNFLGGRYDDTARFWINNDGLLTRYIWNEKENLRWDVRLTELNNE